MIRIDIHDSWRRLIVLMISLKVIKTGEYIQITLTSSVSHSRRVWSWAKLNDLHKICRFESYQTQVSIKSVNVLLLPIQYMIWREKTMQCWKNSPWYIKVSKSQKQFTISCNLPKHERNSLSWAFSLSRIVRFVRFFGRIKDTFRDLLTFSTYQSKFMFSCQIRVGKILPQN